MCIDNDPVNINTLDNPNTSTFESDITLQSLNASVSARKVEVISSPQKDRSIASGYRIIDMELLTSDVISLMRPECSTCTHSFQELDEKRHGLASYLCVHCTSCGYTLNSFSSKKVAKGK